MLSCVFLWEELRVSFRFHLQRASKGQGRRVEDEEMEAKQEGKHEKKERKK